MDRLDRIADKLTEDWFAQARHTNLSGGDRPADIDEAYAIQSRMHQRLALRRGRLAGRKIALSSKAMQEMVGVGHPIAGGFFESDVLRSPAEVAVSQFRHPGIEFELAVRIGQDCTADEIHDSASVQNLIDAAYPAFEVIEDRDADYGDLDALSLIADNAWCGAVVLGPEITGWRDVDLADMPGVIRETGQPDEPTNTGAADPLASLAWVLNHAAGQGAPVRTGELVITGSVSRTRFPSVGGELSYMIAGAAVTLKMV